MWASLRLATALPRRRSIVEQSTSVLFQVETLARRGSVTLHFRLNPCQLASQSMIKSIWFQLAEQENLQSFQLVPALYCFIVIRFVVPTLFAWKQLERAAYQSAATATARFLNIDPSTRPTFPASWGEAGVCASTRSCGSLLAPCRGIGKRYTARGSPCDPFRYLITTTASFSNELLRGCIGKTGHLATRWAYQRSLMTKSKLAIWGKGKRRKYTGKILVEMNPKWQLSLC